MRRKTLVAVTCALVLFCAFLLGYRLGSNRPSATGYVEMHSAPAHWWPFRHQPPGKVISSGGTAPSPKKNPSPTD
jgi:hypothetical protein